MHGDFRCRRVVARCGRISPMWNPRGGRSGRTTHGRDLGDWRPLKSDSSRFRLKVQFLRALILGFPQLVPWLAATIAGSPDAPDLGSVPFPERRPRVKTERSTAVARPPQQRHRSPPPPPDRSLTQSFRAVRFARSLPRSICPAFPRAGLAIPDAFTSLSPLRQVDRGSDQSRGSGDGVPALPAGHHGSQARRASADRCRRGTSAR